MKKRNFKELKNNLSKFARALAEHAFLFFLALIFIGLIMGGFLFYRYSFLAEKAEPEITQEPVQFKENLYQKILEEWQVKEEKFEEAESKQYFNPFQPGKRGETGTGEKKLSEERIQELLANPQIQELLETSNLYEFYIAEGETFLTIEERARIWQELELGQEEEYQGTYSQNIKFLLELKQELTK